jgi:hypothetical protein
MILSTNLPRLLDPQVRKIWDNALSKPKQCMPLMFVEGETNLQVTKDSSISGFSAAQNVAEGAVIPLQDTVAGYTKTYTQGQIGTGFEVTETMIMFDRFDQIVKLPAAIAYAAIQKIEQDAAKLLYNGFITVTGGDGKALIATDHPLTGSALTNNNRIQDAAAVLNPILSVGALDNAQKQMTTIYTEKGELAPAMPSKLVVGAGLWATADVILATMRKPSGSNNDVNRWYNSLELVVNPYINVAVSGTPAYADTMWYLIDDMINPLTWLWSKRPTLHDGYIDYDRKSVKYNVNAFYDFGHSDYRGVMASKGTAVA